MPPERASKAAHSDTLPRAIAATAVLQQSPLMQAWEPAVVRSWLSLPTESRISDGSRHKKVCSLNVHSGKGLLRSGLTSQKRYP